MAPRKLWSQPEDDVVRQRYRSSGLRGVMPLLPNRTKAAVLTRAKTLGCLRRSIVHRPWTPQEDEVMHRLYSSAGWRACQKEMPYRSQSVIQARATRLRLTIERQWTPQEDEALRTLWDLPIGLAAMARDLRRHEGGIHSRAVTLGLPLGVPDGCEYIRDAATRAGYANTGTLRKIMRWAGKPVYVSRSDPHKRGSFRRHYVNSIDVDEAVAAWMQTETIKGAAEARGICWHTLRDWLRSAGLVQPERHAGDHHRIQSSAIDECVAQNRGEHVAR